MFTSVPRKSDEDLRKFVDDFVSNRIFSSAHVQRQDQLLMVFMGLALGGLSDAPKEYTASIGLIYEYYSEAGPRSINGMPCFMSARFLHKDDWKIAYDSIKAEETRRKQIDLVKE